MLVVLYYLEKLWVIMHSSPSLYGIVSLLKVSVGFVQCAIWTYHLFNCTMKSLILPWWSHCCSPVSSSNSAFYIPSSLSPGLYSPLRPSSLRPLLQTCAFGLGARGSLTHVLLSLCFGSLQSSCDKACKHLFQTHCVRTSCSSPLAGPFPGAVLAQLGGGALFCIF